MYFRLKTLCDQGVQAEFYKDKGLAWRGGCGGREGLRKDKTRLNINSD